MAIGLLRVTVEWIKAVDSLSDSITFHTDLMYMCD